MLWRFYLWDNNQRCYFITMLSLARGLENDGRSGGTCENNTWCKEVKRKYILVILWKGITNGFQARQVCVGKLGDMLVYSFVVGCKLLMTTKPKMNIVKKRWVTLLPLSFK
jgi:hypothetical protein